jgi:beta-lactamase class A
MKDIKKNFLLRPVPLYLLLFTLIVPPIMYYIAISPNLKATENIPELVVVPDSGINTNIIRLQDTGLIKPLLLVNSKVEDISLKLLELKIREFVEQKKKDGIVTSAAVYLNDLNTAHHLEINGDEMYDPASLTKVALLLLYLSKEDENPGLLNKSITFKKRLSKLYTPTIKNRSIEEGKTYSVKELLYYMIVYSDNEAFSLLGANVLYGDFIKLCNYFEIPVMTNFGANTGNNNNFVASVNSVSRFFRVLYNSTFLSRKSSQFALSLLAQSEYKDGLLKGIGPNIKVAHKFGERVERDMAQLHEVGIVYIDKNPYLIGVMTKGNDLKQLSDVLGGISKIAYEGMQNKLDGKFSIPKFSSSN